MHDKNEIRGVSLITPWEAMEYIDPQNFNLGISGAIVAIFAGFNDLEITNTGETAEIALE